MQSGLVRACARGLLSHRPSAALQHERDELKVSGTIIGICAERFLIMVA